MSRYTLNSLLYRLKMDPAYRERFLKEREILLGEWEFSEEERTALSAWDLQKLNDLGGYLHSLVRLNRLFKEASATTPEPNNGV